MEDVRDESYGLSCSDQSDRDRGAVSLSLDEIGEVLAEMRF